MISIAYAMGQGGAGGQGAGGFASFIPIILMFAIFYFLLIRPQQKKAKQHREMIVNLKRGDGVVTSGGIHGLITALDDTTIKMEIAEKVRIKVNRSNVVALSQPSSQSKPETTKTIEEKSK